MQKLSLLILAILSRVALADEPAAAPPEAAPTDPAAPVDPAPPTAPTAPPSNPAALPVAPAPSATPAAPASERTPPSSSAPATDENAIRKRRFREKYPDFLAGVTAVYASGTNESISDSAGGLALTVAASYNLGYVGVWAEGEFGANVTTFGFLGHLHFGPQLGAHLTPDVQLFLRYQLNVNANSARDIGASDDVYMTKLIVRYTKYVASAGIGTELFAFPGLGQQSSSLVKAWSAGAMMRIGTLDGLGMWGAVTLDGFSATPERMYDGVELRMSLLVTGA